MFLINHVCMHISNILGLNNSADKPRWPWHWEGTAQKFLWPPKIAGAKCTLSACGSDAQSVVLGAPMNNLAKCVVIRETIYYGLNLKKF